jgi:tryptophan synthase alpha chain
VNQRHAGVDRLASTMDRARRQGRLALNGWQTIGYPDLASTRRLVPALLDGGFDVLELGVPFSDPIADGPTIQRASQRALDNGTTLEDCLELVGGLRASGIDAPLLFMSYLNPLLSMGVDRFADRAAEAGLDGLIVPDLPAEESDDLLRALERVGIVLVYMVAPTSTEGRLRAVGARARGFVYCVSLTGVTGARQRLPDSTPEYLARVRRLVDAPLAVGFGIARPEQVAALRGHADGVIVGSAIVDLMDNAPADQHAARLRDYARSLRDAAGPG